MEDNINKSHKGFKIFVLLLLIGVLFFINKDNQGKLIKAYKSLTIRQKSLEKIESISLDSGINEVGLFDKNIALWGNNKLSIVDINNDLVLEKQFNFENPDIVFGQKSSYIMDKSIGDIYIINSKGETVERVGLDNSINNLIEHEDNVIIHTESEEKENLVLLDTNGVFFRIHPIENIDILTYTFDKKNEKYLISNLNIEDELRSEIQIYSINGELLDKVQIPNEIIIFTEFVNEDLIALTDRCLYYIKDGKVFWKKTFSDIKDILLNNNEIYILYGENLEILDIEGRIISKLSFNKKYSRMKNFDKYLLIYGDNNLIWIQGSKEILDYKHSTDIKDIVINRNYLAIMDDSNLHLFKVINK